MTNEIETMLIFQVERETDAGKQNYIARDLRVNYIDRSGGDKPQFTRGTIQEFRRIGHRVALVQHYREGMLDQLGVDAIVEIDGGPPMHEPYIFEQTDRNTDGMSLTGIPQIDAERSRQDQSMESIMLVSGGPFSGPAKAGFTPREVFNLPLGKTLDGKDVRIKIQDMRPKPPIGVPSVSSVPRV